jgi:predicted transcriptional regulator
MNPPNMKIRSRVDIIASILQMANGGAKRIKMTMNNYHLLRHISLLCENNLLRYDKKENVLRTTPKGIEFLTAYNELVECCHSEERNSLHIGV